jgi:hypothetical protein
MKSKGTLGVVGLVAGLACLSHFNLARAGQKNTYPIVVNLTTKEAEGAVGSARNSSDSTQYIYCAVELGASLPPDQLYGHTAYRVTCVARNSSGQTLSCSHDSKNWALEAHSGQGGVPISTLSSHDIAWLQAVTSMNGDSYVRFKAASNGGDCTELYVENASVLAPKAL